MPPRRGSRPLSPCEPGRLLRSVVPPKRGSRPFSPCEPGRLLRSVVPPKRGSRPFSPCEPGRLPLRPPPEPPLPLLKRLLPSGQPPKIQLGHCKPGRLLRSVVPPKRGSRPLSPCEPGRLLRSVVPPRRGSRPLSPCEPGRLLRSVVPPRRGSRPFSPCEPGRLLRSVVPPRRGSRPLSPCEPPGQTSPAGSPTLPQGLGQLFSSCLPLSLSPEPPSKGSPSCTVPKPPLLNKTVVPRLDT